MLTLAVLHIEGSEPTEGIGGRPALLCLKYIFKVLFLSKGRETEADTQREISYPLVHSSNARDI